MVNYLEVDSVQKRFEEKVVLSDVYLQCKTGEIIGLLGRNGSGKSTLLKIIFGIVNADNKFVRIDGVVKQYTNELLNEISYLPQNNFIPNHFTVKKAIQLSVDKSKVDAFHDDDLISKLLNSKIHQLSGGELRYLEIKLVLNKPSKFVLLDEHYNGLSPLMIDKVNALIELSSHSKGIVITDHNYENVIKISTRLVLMKEGKSHHLNDRKELIEKGYLFEGML